MVAASDPVENASAQTPVEGEQTPGTDDQMETARLETLEPLSTTQTTLTSSYASIVDPNEGTSLKFIPAMTINGVKCAKIVKEDVNPKIEYWQNVVLCSVLGANPPMQVRKRVYMVRFQNQQDKLIVEKHGIYFFDSKPILVEGWNSEMDLHTETIKTLSIWIQFPNLDIKYWGLRV
ncbi:hypothetical protein Cgig2_009964 [Carnegiea gigantea]|uniref:DUF4283 domain-containing protein n=1 Tax=Carnegiea gigantea TaxID=171969 RepID=A0A9Q1JW21_9CARY|nr:hypothetical protein Cgig2_009964 [Carnegiea gigantea]